MQIVDFERKYAQEAGQLALAEYEEERRQILSLPPLRESDMPGTADYAENGMGVAAFENGRMTGFLCGCTPFDNAFGSTSARGVFSPLGAHGAVGENREEIYAAMYQAAAAKWVRAGAVSHAICLYAHDGRAQRQFWLYGFGCRCMDGIRRLDGEHGESVGVSKEGEGGKSPDTGRPGRLSREGYEYGELTGEEIPEAWRLVPAMYESFRNTPFFLNRRPPEKETLLREWREGNARYFGAWQRGKLCAILETGPKGETFLSEQKDYLHIEKAYCLPEHRGRGVYRTLTDHVAGILAGEGCRFLGVDFESINPAGYGFWKKDFQIYTHSVVRRVDEWILKTEKL